MNDLTPSGGGGQGSGGSRARRRILPFAKRRLSVAMPKRNTLAIRLRSGAAFVDARGAPGLRFSALASSARLPKASVSGVATDKSRAY